MAGSRAANNYSSIWYALGRSIYEVLAYVLAICNKYARVVSDKYIQDMTHNWKMEITASFVNNVAIISSMHPLQMQHFGLVFRVWEINGYG